MERTELAAVLNKAKRMYDRLKLSDEAFELWYKLLGKKYSQAEFDLAIEQHMADCEYTPTIAAVKKILVSKFGERSVTESNGPKIAAPQSEIDFCMDVLGAKYVNDRIAALVPGPKTTSHVLKLCRQPGWIPRYRVLLKELVEEANTISFSKTSPYQREIL